MARRLKSHRPPGHKPRPFFVLPMDSTDHSPLVFSGMMPTGDLHLGNYLGALKNWVRMQDDMPCIYCVVDMHALTESINPTAVRQATREVAAAYLASGVDATRSVLFNQSQVH